MPFNKYQLFFELLQLAEIKLNRYKTAEDVRLISLIKTEDNVKCYMTLHDKVGFDYTHVLSLALPNDWENDTIIEKYVELVFMIMLDLEIDEFVCFNLPENLDLLIEMIARDYKQGQIVYFKFLEYYHITYEKYISLSVNEQNAVINRGNIDNFNTLVNLMFLYKLQYNKESPVDVTSSKFISRLANGDANAWKLFIFNTGEQFIVGVEEIDPIFLALPKRLSKHTPREIYTIDRLKNICQERMLPSAPLTMEVTAVEAVTEPEQKTIPTAVLI